MLAVRYEYLKGKSGENVPFAVFVEDELGRIAFSSGIFVDSKKCDIPESLEAFILTAPSEAAVRTSVDHLVKAAIPA